MKTDFAINDMVVMELSPRWPVLTVLTEHAPLLRRFGQVDVVDLDTGHSQSIRRKKADELWAVLEGEAHFSLEDQREDSPTFGQRETIALDGEIFRAVLIPFGVACRVETPAHALCVRLTTHADATTPEDQVPT